MSSGAPPSPSTWLSSCLSTPKYGWVCLLRSQVRVLIHTTAHSRTLTNTRTHFCPADCDRLCHPLAVPGAVSPAFTLHFLCVLNGEFQGRGGSVLCCRATENVTRFLVPQMASFRETFLDSSLWASRGDGRPSLTWTLLLQSGDGVGETHPIIIVIIVILQAVHGAHLGVPAHPQLRDHPLNAEGEKHQWF